MIPLLRGSVESDATVEEAAMQDAASVLGLAKQQLLRPPSALNLDGLGPRQIGYCLSGCTPAISAADVLECGGELESCLHEDSDE